jgi:hypothetical protein
MARSLYVCAQSATASYSRMRTLEPVIECNLRLVMSLARQYLNQGLSVLDELLARCQSSSRDTEAAHWGIRGIWIPYPR